MTTPGSSSMTAAQFSELSSLARRAEALRTRLPRFDFTVAAERQAEYSAVLARHAEILSGVRAAERAAEAFLTDEQRFLDYACPRDSSATFLAGLPSLASLDEG